MSSNLTLPADSLKTIKAIGFGVKFDNGKYYPRMGYLKEDGTPIFAVIGTIPYKSNEDAENIGCKILWDQAREIFEANGERWGFGDDHTLGRGAIQ